MVGNINGSMIWRMDMLGAMNVEIELKND